MSLVAVFDINALFIFQLLGECHCWWTSESPRAHVTKFYCRLWLIRSVLRAPKYPMLKLIEIVILWVYYTISLASACFDPLVTSLSNFRNYFVSLRITDEGSVPEMRIWSKLFIKSDFKWCIHLSRSLFLYCNLKFIWYCKIPLRCFFLKYLPCSIEVNVDIC